MEACAGYQSPGLGAHDWAAGQRSFISKGQAAEPQGWKWMLGLAPLQPEALLATLWPSEKYLASRLTCPFISAHVDALTM